MPAADFGLVLTVLRIIRGWTQEELARASGLRGGTISDYERGKMAPSHKTLQRLLEAMGYSSFALDQVGALIDSLRVENPVTESLEDTWLPGGPAALRREIHQVSADAGRVVSRLTRLMFVVMSSATSEDTGGELPAAE
jgi:transcriptional regulator with XRE-family HTH domain